MSEMLWITVPGGTIMNGEERDAIARVLIMPRLEGSSLKSEGMENWPPESLAHEDAKVKVEFANAVDDEIQALKVKPLIHAETGVWNSFFGPNTVVTPSRRRDNFTPEIVVDSTSKKAKDIVETFNGAASVELSRLNTFVQEKLIEYWSKEEPPIPRTPTVDTVEASCQPHDFHKTIAMLREHPAVLRALGLIIELRIPMSSLPKEGVMKVSWPDVPASLPTIVSPWTKYSNEFFPGSTTNINSGMVTITGDDGGTTAENNLNWDVITVDVDSSSKKLRDAAHAVKASQAGNINSMNDAKTFILPALRTAGIMLVKCNRKNDFKNRRQSMFDKAKLKSMNEAILTADDLVLGYRIDIKQFGREWSSLNYRDALYKIASTDGERIMIGGGILREEGHIKPHAAILENGTLRTDEVLACWRGWSHAVPLPSSEEPMDTPDIVHCPSIPYKFEWEYDVPNATLPRLRFNNTYQLRARVADIAGGGLSVKDPAANCYFSKAVTYRRYEPVVSPDLVLPQSLQSVALDPGESVDQLVIRSDFDTDVNDYPSNAHRLLITPQTSLKMAEQHRAIDGMSQEQIKDIVRQAMVHASKQGTVFANEVLLPDYAAEGVCVFPLCEPGGPSVSRTEHVWGEPWPDFRSMEIVLRERNSGESNVLEWEEAPEIGDPSISARLIVRLAKAEEITLELSSFLKGDCFDHFAINNGDSLPEESRNAVLLGRHPMVTPARIVRLTHAVQRPLRYPQGTLTVLREEGQTFAILTPEPLDLGIDTKSTEKLEVTATWTEQNNNERCDFTNIPVKSITVNRGDNQLKDKIQHELGHTRHVNITYTLTAISRFRQFFKSNDEERFLARTELSISIPSSARPSPPQVLSTRPAFIWEDNKEEEGEQIMLQRRRMGGYLRIELKGPWYETGEGEELAVIVLKDSSQPIENIKLFITQAGRDAIHMAPSPDHWPTAEDFSLNSSPPLEVYLKEAGDYVMVVPYKPWFHDGRWFVDIAIPSLVTNAYMPFVKLALARYQPNSIKNLELSSVVMTEMVQLMPERRLNVRRDGDNVYVKLNGRGPDNQWYGGPDNTLNKWKAILEQFQSSSGIAADLVDLAAIEEPIEGIPAWVNIGDYPPYVLYGEVKSNSPELGPIQIPAGKGPFRIRIQEDECIQGPSGESGPTTGTSGLISARTVYSDIVLLPKTF